MGRTVRLFIRRFLKRKCIVSVSLAESSGEDDRSRLLLELSEKYAGFAEPVAQILAATPSERIIRGAILDLNRFRNAFGAVY